jgi:hypothetical protein
VVIDYVHNFSVAKINESINMYLGCADPNAISSKIDCFIDPLAAYSFISSRFIKPIAGLPSSKEAFSTGISTCIPQDIQDYKPYPSPFIFDELLPKPQISPGIQVSSLKYLNLFNN